MCQGKWKGGGDSPSQASNREARGWKGVEIPLRAEKIHPGCKVPAPLQNPPPPSPIRTRRATHSRRQPPGPMSGGGKQRCRGGGKHMRNGMSLREGKVGGGEHPDQLGDQPRMPTRAGCQTSRGCPANRRSWMQIRGRKNGCPEMSGRPKWGGKRNGEMHWLRRLRHRRLCLSLRRAQGPA